MSTSDHTHRDDFDLSEAEPVEVADVGPPALLPGVTNLAAAQAATAQRTATAGLTPVGAQRQFTEDLPPPQAPAREYTIGGGSEPGAPRSVAAAREEPSDPTGALHGARAVRGPPPPRAVELGGEISWVGFAHQAHSLADDPEQAAAWIAPGSGNESRPLHSGPGSGNESRPLHSGPGPIEGADLVDSDGAWVA